MATTYTLQDLYDISYGIIAQGQDSTAYPLTLMKAFLNKAQNDICYGNVQNLSTNERLEKQALTFLDRTQFYTTKNYSTLAATAVVGATTLTVTNQFSTSGLLWINGAIISYSGNNGTTLTGIPTTGDLSIPFAFTSGSKVFQLNALPTDFGQVSRAFLTIQGNMNRSKLVSVDSRDLMSPIPNTRLYNFMNSYSNSWNGTDLEWYYSLLKGTYVLFLVPQSGNQPIAYEYQKKPTQLVNPTDVLTIPDEYSLTTIPYMAVSEMFANR